jgi:hypothetical protein
MGIAGVWLAMMLVCNTKIWADSPEDMSPSHRHALGDGEIRGMVHGREVIVATTARVAGAVDSLRWSDLEFIDSYDHGRQLQSAASFDCGRDDPFWPERFNPTEAGSRGDGLGPTSSSELQIFEVDGRTLQTKNRMAFWLAPGEESFGRAGLNGTKLSNHWLEKRIQVGCKASPDAIQFDLDFQMPADELHRLAQFEVLTGYMPPYFERFVFWDAVRNQFSTLSDGPGEQPYPLAFSTSDGAHALGVWMVPPSNERYSPIGYGRFRFETEKVVKWNCAVRIASPTKVDLVRHSFRVYVVVGSLNQVASTFQHLQSRLDQSR